MPSAFVVGWTVFTCFGSGDLVSAAGDLPHSEGLDACVIFDKSYQQKVDLLKVGTCGHCGADRHGDFRSRHGLDRGAMAPPVVPRQASIELHFKEWDNASQWA